MSVTPNVYYTIYSISDALIYLMVEFIIFKKIKYIGTLKIIPGYEV